MISKSKHLYRQYHNTYSYQLASVSDQNSFSVIAHTDRRTGRHTDRRR